MATAEQSLADRLEEFYKKANEGSWTQLFLLARQRAQADGISIAEALTQEINLRL